MKINFFLAVFGNIFLAFNSGVMGATISYDRTDAVNEKVKVTTVLDMIDVRQTITVSIIAKEEIYSYHLILPNVDQVDPSLLLIEAKLMSSSSKQTLPVIRGTGVAELNRKYNAGEKIDIEFKLVWKDIARPLPKSISQTDKDQKFLVDLYATFNSPYLSNEQVHIVHLPSKREPLYWGKNVEDLTPASRMGNVVTYGPYKDVGRFVAKKVRFHFFNSNAPLVAKSFQKTIKVSYWTPELHIQEDYELHHKGALLKGHFSQIDHKLTQYDHSSTPVVKSLVANLPPGASDVFFKDVVGNISTSNLRNEKKRTVLEIRPRYPLFGGWKFTWFHGYTVPNFPVLGMLKGKKNQYKFELDMVPSVLGISVEKAIMKVILPEGASDIKVESPFTLDSEQHDTTFTYFDTTGRPTVILVKENLIEEYHQPVRIIYSYPSWEEWRKPLVIFTAITLLLGTFYLLASLDLSIIPDPKKILKKKIVAARQEVSKILQKENKALTRLEKAFIDYKSTHAHADFQKIISGMFAIRKQCHEKLAGSFLDITPAFASVCKVLSTELEGRMAIGKTKYDAVIKFFENEGKQKNADEQREQLNKLLTKLEKDTMVIEEKIAKLLPLV